MITKIHNAEEWENFYYYAPKYKPKAYPKDYPCFAEIRTEGGGLMGEYEAHYVTYLPRYDLVPACSDEESFEEGLNAKWEFIC